MIIVRWNNSVVLGEVSKVSLDVLLEFCLIRVIDFGLLLNLWMLVFIYFKVNIWFMKLQFFVFLFGDVFVKDFKVRKLNVFNL